MSDLNDYKDEIDAWADMWDEMQDKGVHPQSEKPQLSSFANKVLNDDPADSYYDYFNGQDDLLSEEIVTTQNPVRMDTVGKDNEKPEPAWVSEDLLDEIQKMKDQLFKIENQLAKMGQGKTFSEKPVTTDNKNLNSKVERLRKEIDRLSDKLGLKDDPTPYKIKAKKP